MLIFPYMQKESIDDYVANNFRLINSRRRAEFMAFFPDEGTTQLDITVRKIFSKNKSVTFVNLKKYLLRNTISKQPEKDEEGYKEIQLTLEGHFLQTAARYMLIINKKLNQEFNTDRDYLNVFFEKASPDNLLRVMQAIYEGNAQYVSEISRTRQDRDTRKMVDRLEEYGLIETRYVEKDSRKHRKIKPTKLGKAYYSRLLQPVIGNIQAIYHLTGNPMMHTARTEWAPYVKAKDPHRLLKTKGPSFK